jgi:hypothetical protein
MSTRPGCSASRFLVAGSRQPYLPADFTPKVIATDTNYAARLEQAVKQKYHNA